MRVRLPLYSKILGWFFVNLVVVATVVVALFDAQFHFNLDWFFMFGARERLEAVRDLIVGELSASSPDDWHGVLQRYNEAHHVQFALYDDDANLFLGEIPALPPAVVERIVARPQFNRPRPADQATPIAEPTRERSGSSSRRWGLRPPLRALMRTTDPTQYWLLASGRLENPMIGDPMRVVIVGQSDTLSAGGLIFDPKPWLALGGGVIAFSLLFWLPLVRGITVTVGRMMHATRQIADGRFDVRLNMRRRDELGALGASIDQMAARLDGLVTGQKRFLGDIAHELCSPLARLQLALGILEQRAGQKDTEFVRAASEKAEQIATLVGELLSFSKASYGAPVVRLQSPRIRDAAAEALRREGTDGADVRIEIDEQLRAVADPDLLTRALGNLIRNAIRHAGAAGPITMHAARVDQEVEIVVADCGPGVPEEDLPRIFDAFYRVDASRTRDTGGSGLGLAIVKACVESCCGSVTARNRQPHGLEIRILLPVAVGTDSGIASPAVAAETGG